MTMHMYEIRFRYKDILGMALYVLIYFPQCVREMKVTVRWNPNRKNRNLKMVSTCYTTQVHVWDRNVTC